MDVVLFIKESVILISKSAAVNLLLRILPVTVTVTAIAIAIAKLVNFIIESVVIKASTFAVHLDLKK